MGGIQRKARRLAEKTKSQLEKRRTQEASNKQKQVRKSRAYTDMYENEDDWHEHLSKLQERYERGDNLTLREADILCLGLKEAVRINCSICDDTRFVRLYLNHFHAQQNNGYISEDHKKQLDEFTSKWKAEILDDRHDTDRLYIEVRKETRLTIKSMKSQNSSLSSAELVHKENEIFLRSKNIHIKIKRLLEGLGTSTLKLNIGGEEVHLDEFTLIHSLFRHYSELTKQYNDKKSYFTPEIPIEEFPTIVKERILGPISEDGAFENSLPKSIFLKYYGRLYRLYFEDKSIENGHSTVKRVNTFYPVDQDKDIEASKNYFFKKLNAHLSVGIEKGKA